MPEAEPVIGVLDNGVHYAILPHGGTQHQVSVSLLVRAGSLDETDSERGYAHFVEHMAFDGSTHYPPGAIGVLFQRLGLAWGPDLNASTHSTYTDYDLELPAGKGGELSTALDVLRDYADGLLFPPEQLKSEAGVVISEMHQREGEGLRASEQIDQVLYRGTLLPAREVIGTEASVRAATPDSLRAFYRRCYTPGRMSVVIVGPVDAAAAAGRILRAFGSMARRPDAPPPVFGIPPVPHGIEASHFTDADMKSSMIRFVFTGTRDPDTESGRADEIIQQVVMSLLDQRLSSRREDYGSRVGFTHAGLTREDFGPYLRRELELQASHATWEQGVGIVENELRYARQLGFRDAEIADAVQEHLTYRRNQVDEELTAPSKLVAAELVTALATDRVWQTAQAREIEAEKALDGLDQIRVHNVFRDLFPDGVGHLVVRSGPGLSLSEGELLAAFRKSEKHPIEILSGSASAVFAYGDLGPPGAIAESRRDEGLGIDMIRFANGVRVNCRRSGGEPGRFQMRVGLGRGTPDIPVAMAGFPALADGLMNACELTRQNNSEISRLLAVRDVTYHSTMVDGASSILISGPTSQLSFALQLVAARLTDTHFNRDRMGAALSFYAGTRNREFSTPLAAAESECLYEFSGRDDRVLLPRLETALTYSFPAVYSWLDENWLKGPIEVGVVGDVTAAEVTRAAAVTLGDLPRRKRRSTPGYPKQAAGGAHRVELNGGLQAGAAGACITWPVSFSGDARQLAAAELVADVLNDRLRVALREKLGATYTPETVVRRDRFQRDFGYVQSHLSFDPPRAAMLTDMAVEIAGRFAQEGATLEEFSRLREPRLTRARNSLESDRWWLDAVVAYAQSQPGGLAEVRGFLEAHEAVSLADVNQLAGALSTGQATVVVVQPAKPTAH